MIQRNHPVDQILGDISKEVTTRSRLANFCEHYSFVSSIEPFRVEEALQDPNWVLAMQEELNDFKRNEVWSLVSRPKQNVVGTKWVFRNKQDEHRVVTRNKARLVAKGYLLRPADIRPSGSRTARSRQCCSNHWPAHSGPPPVSYTHLTGVTHDKILKERIDYAGNHPQRIFDPDGGHPRR